MLYDLFFTEMKELGEITKFNKGYAEFARYVERRFGLVREDRWVSQLVRDRVQIEKDYKDEMEKPLYWRRKGIASVSLRRVGTRI